MVEVTVRDKTLGTAVDVPRPGLTGLRQVHGRPDLSREEPTAFAVRSAETWRLGRDLSIVMPTIAVVLVGRGAS